ncbi:MAG: flavin-dependent monooxygenase [Proteobacteria bacterium]|nr:flavin-dependent monooxygenase [Pseudomonadota bacterium]
MPPQATVQRVREPVTGPEITPQAYLAGIDALLPGLCARSADTEALGRIPDDIINDLTHAHVFRALQPVQWGGLELDPATFFEGMVRLASACGSTGWVASVVGVHAWHIALFAEAAQREVWGRDPDARAATSLAPTGAVRREEGGFHLSGRWSFCSGVDHCAWVLLGGLVPPPDPGEVSEYRTFLVPRAAFDIDQQSWNVTGLAGTGSKDIVVSGTFVPAHRTHSVIDVYHQADPGFAINDRPLYRLPWHLMFCNAIAAPSIGAAVGALRAFVDNNRVRVPAMGGPPVAQNPAMHRRLAQSMTEVEATRARVEATWRTFLGMAEAGEEIPYLQRVQCKYEAAHALAVCPRAVYEVLEMNGGRTMHADTPLQRFYRDLLAMRNHPAAALESAASLYGGALLGGDRPPFNPSQRIVL